MHFFLIPVVAGCLYLTIKQPTLARSLPWLFEALAAIVLMVYAANNS
jgi:hypothetical protein